jgi:O-antigen/teichoic acid export membrane protein
MSAILSFGGLLLVARLLPTAEYGRYATIVALVELSLNIGSLGLDWVSTRYVPEYRTKAGGQQLARFIIGLSAVQGALLCIIAGALATFAEPLSRLLGIDAETEVIRLYSIYLVLEGTSRVLRDQMLSQLLLQGRAQFALVLRHLVWVGVCAAIWWEEGHTVLHVIVRVEVGAAALGLTVAAAGLFAALRQASREPDILPNLWAAPSLDDMRRLAVNNYFGFLLNLPARPQVLTLLVARIAGIEMAAIYGFARSLTDQVLRFLPAELLLGFIRPALISNYIESRDFDMLNRQTNILLILSLIVLSPLLATVVGQGELVVTVLGAGRYSGSGAPLMVMLLSMGLFSHRRVLEFVANTISAPQAIGRASLIFPVMPVLVLVLLLRSWPLWCVPLAPLFAEAVFGVLVVQQFRRLCFHYKPPLQVAGKLCVAILAGGAMCYLVPTGGASVATLLASALVATVTTLVVALWTKAFTIEQIRFLLKRI